MSKPVPEPTKLVALKVLLFQDKLVDCINEPVAFPINNWFAFNVCNPVPPWLTFNFPVLILDAFKLSIPVPEPIKLVALKVLLFQDKFEDCINVPVAFPINNWFAFNVFNPVPPYATFKVPKLILDAFKLFKPVPEPTKLVALKVLLVQDKFDDCINAPVVFPINNWFAFNVCNPVPPCATFNLPVLIFVAFKLSKPVPEPTKLVALKVLLFQDRFDDCINVPIPFPINNWFTFNDVLPVPP